MKKNLSMRKVMSDNKASITLLSLLKISASAAMVYAGYSLSFIMKNYDGKLDVNMLVMTSLKVLAIWGIAIIIYTLSGVYTKKVIAKINVDIRYLMAEKILSLDYTEFNKLDTGNYLSWLTNDVKQIEAQSFTSLFTLISEGFTAIFSLLALFYINLYVGLAAIGTFIIISVLPQLAGKILQKETQIYSKKQEEATESFKDSVMGVSILKLSRLYEEFLNRIKNSAANIEDANYKFNKVQIIFQSFVIFISIIGQIILLFVTVMMAIMGKAAIGAVLAVGNLAGSFYQGVQSAVSSFMMLKSSKAIWDKIEITKKDNKDLIKLEKDDISSIICKNLSYSYDGSTKLIDAPKLVFEKGKKYALVGESGSGKTTLAKLIMGFLPNYEGEIYFGSNELRDIDKDYLYKNIAYADQKPYLFSDSLLFNICLGKNYSNDEIKRAIKSARLEDFVESLPNGLDTVIGEDGKNISGGQKQRIALARYLIRGVSFIIIDEGTSSLDNKNAVEIEKALVQNDDIGVIFITHNLRDEIREKLDNVYTGEDFRK